MIDAHQLLHHFSGGGDLGPVNRAIGRSPRPSTVAMNVE
jgi:hypothetical protein